MHITRFLRNKFTKESNELEYNTAIKTRKRIIAFREKYKIRNVKETSELV